MSEPWVLHRHRRPLCLRGLLSYRVHRSVRRVNSESTFLSLEVIHFCLSYNKTIHQSFEYLPIPQGKGYYI